MKLGVWGWIVPVALIGLGGCRKQRESGGELAPEEQEEKAGPHAGDDTAVDVEFSLPVPGPRVA